MAKSSVRLARRYARALFESYEPSQLESVRDALQSLARVWSTSSELRDAVLHPTLPIQQRVSVMQDLADRVRTQDERFRNFCALLVQNGRAEAVPDVAVAFAALVAAVRKVLAVQICSAHPVPSAEQQALLQRLQSELGGMASITWSVDSNLLGGLTVKTGDRLLDSSVRGALQRLRNELRA